MSSIFLSLSIRIKLNLDHGVCMTKRVTETWTDNGGIWVKQ
jgi:hypothetical protein